MQRREFMQSIAASVAAVGVLPQAAQAASNAIDRLRRQIGGADDIPWQAVRKSFLLKPGLTHLNCGSLGACPQLVVDGVAQFMREIEQDPVHQNWGPLGAPPRSSAHRRRHSLAPRRTRSLSPTARPPA